MDAEVARQFRDRWKAVAAVEAEEQKTVSITLRWKQLNVLLGMAIGLGLSVADSEEEEVKVVRQRWMKLKAAWT